MISYYFVSMAKLFFVITLVAKHSKRYLCSLLLSGVSHCMLYSKLSRSGYNYGWLSWLQCFYENICQRNDWSKQQVVYTLNSISVFIVNNVYVKHFKSATN